MDGASPIIREPRNEHEFDFPGTERYQVVSHLGAGGMGVVYKVYDNDTDSFCALKTLRRRDADAFHRFKNEFRALQDLRHPNLISLGELGEVDGSWYFTMELVEGTDLLTYVREGTIESGAQFSEDRLRSGFAQVLRGLSALHSNGMVHRDIKPSNIRVRRDGRVVLLDFGLVVDTLADDRSKDSWVIGTAAYMAPEQAQHEASPATDCYALGIILYEALTGEVPFRGTDIEILMNKQRERPVPPASAAKAVPGDLDELCQALLRTDPADRPTASEALRRLGDTPQAPVVTSRLTRELPNVFVGRESELERMLAAVSDPREAHTFTIRGPTGVGKSALVQRFIERVKEQHSNAVVLRGRCYERETVRFKAVDGVVDALTRFMRAMPKADAAALLPQNVEVLAQVFPVLRRVDVIGESPRRRGRDVEPQELRQRAFASLRELFSRIALRRPLVLAIDDLQWADSDSVALLREIMQPPDVPPMTLVVAQRTPAPGDPDLAARIAEDGSAIVLASLDPGNAHALANDLLSRSGADLGDDAARALAREADGHPLFIHELARYMVSSGKRTARLVQLDDALRYRFEHLSREARDLLRVVGVVAGPLEQESAALAAQLDFRTYSDAAQELRLAHLARTSGFRRTDIIEPYHDRVWEAVQSELDTEEQSEIHRRLGQAFETTGLAERSPEFAMRHFEAAGQQSRAAFHAEAAAERAMQGLAFDRAAMMYRRALELGEYEGDDRKRLQLAFTDALVFAGRGPEATDILLELADKAESARRLDLQRRAAEELLVAGHVERGTEVMRRVLQGIGRDLPKSNSVAILSLLWQRLRLRLRLGGLRYRRRSEDQLSPMDLARLDVYGAVSTGLLIIDNLRAADFISRYLRRALRMGEPRRLARAFCLESNQHSAMGKPRRARQLIAEIDKLVDPERPGMVGVYALLARVAESYFLNNDWSAALGFMDELETRLRKDVRLGGWEAATIKTYTCFCLNYLGELEECGSRVARYLRESDQRGNRYLSANLRTRMVLSHLAHNDPAHAEAQVDDALSTWPDMEHRYQVQHFFSMHSKGEIALYTGDTRNASALVARHWSGLRGSGMLYIPLVSAEICYLRGRIALARAADEPAGANSTQLVDEAQGFARRLRRLKIPVAAGCGSVLRAGIANVLGDEAGAVAELRRALSECEDLNLWLNAHAVRRRLGAMLGGDEGGRMVSTADQFMRRQGVKDMDAMTRMLVPGWR